MENTPVNTSFVTDIKNIIKQARDKTVFAINTTMVTAYWHIGKRIVEEEQNGTQRAEYGKELLKNLAVSLSSDFGKTFDARELRRMRQFYACFPKRDSLRPELTWTHYRLLLRVENIEARNYYIKESISQHWSTRKLDRNISSQYFQRTLANQLPKNIEISVNHQFIKDPYVLEFLDLPNNLSHKEKDIENAIIQQLQQFLLEMGKGFAFVGQQKMIKTETSNFFIDLVFYNYILKCFVVIDIKTTKLTHQDIGQLDMYVRMFDDIEKADTDNPTIGILLCADTDNVVAKYSVLNDNKQLFASKYQLYLPTTEELQNLIENTSK